MQPCICQLVPLCHMDMHALRSCQPEERRGTSGNCQNLADNGDRRASVGCGKLQAYGEAQRQTAMAYDTRGSKCFPLLHILPLHRSAGWPVGPGATVGGLRGSQGSSASRSWDSTHENKQTKDKGSPAGGTGHYFISSLVLRPARGPQEAPQHRQHGRLISPEGAGPVVK